MKLTLKDMLLILWKRLALIILAIIIGAGVSLAYTFVFVKPEYTATAKLYVYNERTDSNYITSGDLTVSKSLVDTYLIIIKSNPVLNEVANKLSKNYPQITPSEILKSFSGSAINETEAFYVSATGTNAQLAQDIVNTIIDVAPEEIIRVVKAASVEIIEPAEFPIMPDWPIQRNLIIGIALGLVFAICYIIIAAYMDSTIHGKNEIMACFNIPIIGNIPMSEKEEQEKKKRHLFGKKKDNFDIFGRNLVINEKTPFAITEAYKKARTNVFYLPIEGNCHKIVLTSALAAEGKTVASINITKLLAQAGKRVLLIDADMRNPKVSRYLGLDEQAGLSEYLAGICPVAEVLQNDAIGADVIVSGKSSSSAAELLATARMDLLLEEKENDYDYIIIDTPPINIVTDSLILADKVNGYLIGVRAEYSNTVSLKQAVTSLEQVDANILGVILINTDPKVEEYGQYGAYSKYHAYRYNYNNDYNPAEFNENSATGENNKKNRNRYERRS